MVQPSHDLSRSERVEGALFPEDPNGPDVAPTEIVYDWDLQSDEITWSANYANVAGLPPVAVLGTGLGLAEHLAAASPSSRYEAVMAPGGCDLGNGVPFTAVYGLVAAKRSKAAPVWVEDSGRWFADSNNRPCRVHGVVRVITERYEADRLRTAAAQRDPLTGASTRAHFIEHVTRQLSLTARKTSTFAVLLIGVRQAGAPDVSDDAKMLEAASRLRPQMRSNEILARYAPTKFAALLDACDEERAAAAAGRFMEAIEDTLEAQPPLAARVGAVLAPCHGRTPQALLQFAEDALDAAHRSAERGYALYRPELTRVRPRPPTGASDDLLAALDGGRITLALQPIVSARSREVAFYEGLVRVRGANGSLTLPEALLSSAEKNGLVPLVDRRVIELAFALLTTDRKLALSINAAVPSLSDPQWLEQLRMACRLRPDAARRLTIEVTETCAIADIEAMRATLAAIKPLGVKIAIDDFGSGHSSFRTLRKLPIDYLKIDGAFAQNLASSQDDRFFIRTLIDLARNLNIPTVAEWVEDEATAQILADWGVDYFQGHLFGKAEAAPLPATLTKAAR